MLVAAPSPDASALRFTINGLAPAAAAETMTSAAIDAGAKVEIHAKQP